MAGHDKSEGDADARQAAPVLKIDYALYDRYLEEADLNEDQKREFLDSMWAIIVEFVMLGYEVHPAQQAQKACGKLPKTYATPTNAEPDAVELSDSPKTDFSDAAERKDTRAERIQE